MFDQVSHIVLKGGVSWLLVAFFLVRASELQRRASWSLRFSTPPSKQLTLRFVSVSYLILIIITGSSQVHLYRSSDLKGNFRVASCFCWRDVLSWNLWSQLFWTRCHLLSYHHEANSYPSDILTIRIKPSLIPKPQLSHSSHLHQVIAAIFHTINSSLFFYREGFDGEVIVFSRCLCNKVDCRSRNNDVEVWESTLSGCLLVLITNSLTVSTAWRNTSSMSSSPFNRTTSTTAEGEGEDGNDDDNDDAANIDSPLWVQKEGHMQDSK